MQGSPDGSKMVVQALTAAAAHVGSHYWTNDDNRQLAQGNVLALVDDLSPLLPDLNDG